MKNQIVLKMFQDHNDDNVALTSETNSKLLYGELKLFVNKLLMLASIFKPEPGGLITIEVVLS